MGMEGRFCSDNTRFEIVSPLFAEHIGLTLYYLVLEILRPKVGNIFLQNVHNT